ncbi:multicopper oxidase family protein [Acidiphilium sp.]|jgi:FtsP/CotA-like multicopper oxidase with cupredoxin domain|uniref:multicopper oxidase family protein n=1 Tax=Acidiphilium sp. TaxID=527 RepID=UPI00258CAC23|nr:multicopper oxidase family protein [Acidiphilium sp.]
MKMLFSRRQLLASGAAATMLAGLPEAHAQTSAKRLAAGTRVIDVNGKPARVFHLSGPDGKPGLRLAPGERFNVLLANEAAVPTIIHWHGQLPPWTQDGFPWPQTPPLAPGATHVYDFAPIPGTYWMHSHRGLQEQSLMTAPLIVRDVAEAREDRQEIVLMLHDFSFRTPDELLAGLTGTSVAVAGAMSEMMENVPAPVPRAATPHSAMAMSSAMSGMATSGSSMTSGSSSMPGMGSMHMDLNDVDYHAFLANDRTLADPEVVRVERAGRARLRVINGASSSQFWLDLGGLTGRVVAVDGHGVIPVSGRRFPIAIAQRLDILLDLPDAGAFPVTAELEGTRRRTGIILATSGAAIAELAGMAPGMTQPVDNSLEARLRATAPLTSRKPDVVHQIVLSGGMQPYAWSLNGAFWPKITPLVLTKGQRVEIELINHSTMAHPMHLHGHSFQVIALNGRPVNGAVRDTVLVEPMPGSVRIAFDAVNPGRWAFHCHNLYHMATGMMTEFRYDGIVI